MANNQAKRVLIFSTAYFPLIGGAEVAVKEITDRIKEYQFDLITAKLKADLARKDKYGRVNIYRVGLGIGWLDKLLLPCLSLFKAIKLNKKNDYQIVWALMASQGGIGAAFFKILNKKKKLVLTLQEGDTQEYLKRYVLNIDWLYRLLIKPFHLLPIKKADLITVISRYLKQRAIQSGAKAKIAMVPNGVDLENFTREFSLDELNRLKNQLGKKPEDKYLITTSRLVEKNGLDSVIKALVYLPEKVKFLILGVGPLEKKLKKLSFDLGIKDRVIFLNQISHQEIPKYLKISDIFIRPSLSEGLGNSFLEAMAAGLPIIGTQVGGIPDFLENRKTGLFCRISNSQDIAEKVKELLGNEKLRNKLIKNGLELVQKKYNWDLIASHMGKAFKNLNFEKI